MPYNTSKNVIKKMKGELDALAKGKAVTFKTANPHKLAYNIREAIAASQRHGVHPYADLDFVFKARAGKVVATPRVEIDDTPVEAEFTPPPEPKPQPRSRTVDRETTEFDVIQELTHLEEGSMIFTAFIGQMEAVENWVSKRDNMYLMDRDPLTIRREG